MTSSSVFLENRGKERWEDISTGRITYILYPRSLIQTTGAGQACWNFSYGERTSRRGENIEVAELKKTSGFILRGAVSMAELTTGLDYEAAFVVKLKDGGQGWEHPVTLTLSVPGEREKRRLLNLYEQPRGVWIELKAGYFKAAGTGEVSFHLLQDDGAHDKKGLVLKSAVVRPKS